jgi:hypothetical protein
MDDTGFPSSGRAATRSTWRMIVVTALFALAVLGATSVTLRAVAQTKAGVPESVPKETPAAPDDPADADAGAEGPRRAAPPKTSDEEAPEFRESADNNISLPIDI